ncbi:MAG: hypothetical protein KC503_27500 [Myxococcales bacterium]|nr:hypothetical protein [Myxococcales bacterium]
MSKRTRDGWNGCRFRGGGHYESWFQRANHPQRPLAFWVRYTIFSPASGGAAVGELWAVWFDGEQKQVSACKQVLPIEQCRFARHGLDVSVGGARLDSTSLAGEAHGQGRHISWSLRYSSPSPPLLLLPERLYDLPLPKAKALVGSPGARFEGDITVDGERHAIDDWVGSQNHNWGSKHTDRYAWGQVAGFDEAPDAFFEVATARIKVGPLWVPPMTLMVLRLDGEVHELNSITGSLRARASYDPSCWRFESAPGDVRIRGEITAPREAFVALPYDNPPGGRKTCLNSKIARCELTVSAGGRSRQLTSACRAAFEILTDDVDHGVQMLDA